MINNFAKFLFGAQTNIVCDDVSPMTATFRPADYMGTWYDIQHTGGTTVQPDFFDCTQAIYSDLDTETGVFKVYNSSTVGFLPRTGVHGTAGVAGQPNGWAVINFFGTQKTEANYKVLDTDYENYSLVYACDQEMGANLWILGRSPTMDEDLFDSLNA